MGVSQQKCMASNIITLNIPGTLGRRASLCNAITCSIPPSKYFWAFGSSCVKRKKRMRYFFTCKHNWSVHITGNLHVSLQVSQMSTEMRLHARHTRSNPTVESLHLTKKLNSIIKIANIDVKVDMKVKRNLEPAMKAQRWSRGIALLFL